MSFDKWRHYVRARMLEMLRKPDEAIAEFKLALEFDPRFRKAANALGYRYARLGRHREAADCFERVVGLDAADAIAHYNLGFNYDKAGASEKAIGSFRAAVQLNPRFDLAWYGMGLAHAALGAHREAMEAFDKAAGLQPMSAPVWYQLGMACHHAREPERLRGIIEHVNRFDPRMARRLIQETGSSNLAYLVKDLVV